MPAPTRSLCASLLVTATSLAVADVINVPDDVPDIETAAWNAEQGDEIVIAPGTYALRTTALLFTSDVTIRGATGEPSDVIVVMDGEGFRLIDVTGILFDALTFTNATTAVMAQRSSLTLRNCDFIDNDASRTSNQSTVSADRSTVHIDSCRFVSNDTLSDWFGAAVRVDGTDLTVVSSEFRHNTIEATPGGFGGVQSAGAAILVSVGTLLDPSPSTVRVTESAFIGNDAGFGAAIFNSGGDVLLDRCTFTANTALTGGAVHTTPANAPWQTFEPEVTITNSLFNANRASVLDDRYGRGGAIANVGPGVLTLVNNTLVNNEAETEAGVVWTVDGAVTTVANCLLSGSTPAGSPISGAFTAINNLDAPLASIGFADQAGPDGTPGTGDDDFSLLPGSPAIDAGDSTALPPPAPFDLTGRPRFVDDPATPDTGIGPAPVIDIGAHEFSPVPGCSPADLAAPLGVLDLADINAFTTAFTAQDPSGDLDGNSVFDLADITAFVTAFLAGCP